MVKAFILQKTNKDNYKISLKKSNSNFFFVKKYLEYWLILCVITESKNSYFGKSTVVVYLTENETENGDTVVLQSLKAQKDKVLLG